MRKIILKMQISLDGVVSGEGEWMSFSDSIVSDVLEYYDNLDTIIIGSKFYSFLSDYWQTAEKSSTSQTEKLFAHQINKMYKIVPSRSTVNLTWKNSEHLLFKDKENFIKLIQEIRGKEGKNISIESGIGMWKLFIDNNLFDELLLYVHPTIVGNGVKIFDKINDKAYLKLKSSKTLDKDVIKLHYEKSRS